MLTLMMILMMMQMMMMLDYYCCLNLLQYFTNHNFPLHFRA
jgi:hypothetical protein